MCPQNILGGSVADLRLECLSLWLAFAQLAKQLDPHKLPNMFDTYVSFDVFRGLRTGVQKEWGIYFLGL